MKNQICKYLQEKNLDALIIFDNDYHQSEYNSEHFLLREFLSGFSGSAGVLVFTQEKAMLFTDGRYFLQAEKELKDGFLLVKSNDFVSFLQSEFNGKKIAADFAFLPYFIYEKIAEFSEFVHDSLQSDLAKKHLKTQIFNPIFEQNECLNAFTIEQKLAKIYEFLEQNKGDVYLLSALDDIAYFLNLRGSDIAYNPVFFAFLLLSKDKNYLFANGKIDEATRQKLEKNKIFIKNYFDIYSQLSSLDGVLLCDKSSSAKLVFSAKCEPKFTPNFVQNQKAIKTPCEIAHIKNAHIKDGVALVEFYYQLEQDVKNGVKISESDIQARLTQCKKRQNLYVCESFECIAAANENAAIVHYSPTNSKTLLKNGDLLLIDTGSNYRDGTTDITRTIILNDAKSHSNFAKIKADYTLVLRSHIALASAIFKTNFPFKNLDLLARAPLWQQGKDYLHGTGHGVGNFLCVHEAPISLSPGSKSEFLAQEGIVTSIEPGIYEANSHGIRLENLYAVCHSHSSEYGEFLRFCPLSLYPFERDLIDENSLNQDEKNWLNSYHSQVFATLKDFLDDEKKEFLAQKCQAI